MLRNVKLKKIEKITTKPTAALAKKKSFTNLIEKLNDTLALSMCNASNLGIFSDDSISRDDIILDELKSSLKKLVK